MNKATMTEQATQEQRGPCSACGDGDTAMNYHSHSVLEENESLRAQLDASQKENERLRILAERAYPELKASGLCSHHGGPGFTDYPVTCTICYVDLRALITEHVEVRERLLANARAENERLLRGEFTCKRCGIRKNGEHDSEVEF